MYFCAIAEDAARGAHLSLSYREQRIEAQRLTFCSDCLSAVSMENGECIPLEKQMFFDIALSHDLVSAKAVEKAYQNVRQS